MPDNKKFTIFNGQFTQGNLATIIVVIVTIAIAWGSLKEKVEANEKQDNLHHNNTAMHYTVDSPLYKELECLRKEISRLNELLIKYHAELEKRNGK